MSNMKHGHTSGGYTLTYLTWAGMRARCTSKNSPYYGLPICERWGSFENFLADMGDRPSKAHSLDRINGHLGYSPENCRWATRKQQAQNRPSFVLRFTANGETGCLMQLCESRGVHYNLVYSRLRRGWSIDDALSIPPSAKFRNSKTVEARNAI